MDEDAADRAIDRQAELMARHLDGTGLGLRLERSETSTSCYLEIFRPSPLGVTGRGHTDALRIRLSDHPPRRDDALALDLHDPEAWIDAVVAACERFGVDLPASVVRARRFRGRN
ncbi:MAG: hypothetical protein RID91_03735 [Azospirillaceae bacterium]